MAMAKGRQRRTRCLRILFLKASFTKFCAAIIKLPFRFVLPSSFLLFVTLKKMPPVVLFLSLWFQRCNIFFIVIVFISIVTAAIPDDEDGILSHLLYNLLSTLSFISILVTDKRIWPWQGSNDAKKGMYQY